MIPRLFKDKDNGSIYCKSDLLYMWNQLPEDVKQDYQNDGISTFEDWLDAATDFSGHLQAII